MKYLGSISDSKDLVNKEYVDNLIAPAYSSSSAYSVGQGVIYNNKLYKCNTAIPSPGEIWTSAHWTEVKMANTMYDVSELKSAFNDTLLPTRNLLDIGNPNLANNVTLSKHGESVTLTAKTNNTYLNAVYVIDTQSIDFITVTYKPFSGTGSGGVRIGYNNNGDPSSPTWLSYALESPKTINVSAYDYILIGLYAVVSTNAGAGHYITYNKVQVESGKAASAYIPHFVPADIVAREGNAENSQRIEAVSGYLKNVMDAVTYPTSIVTTPLGFTWQDSPIVGKVRNDYKGGVYVDYDISVNDPSENGTTYYVDIVNGADANDGLTPDTALYKISTALAKADVSCIMVKGGIYFSNNNIYNSPITKTVAIKGMPGEDVIISQTSLTTFTEDTDHTGTYYGTRGNCYGVVDIGAKNEDGDGLLYMQKTSVNDVYTTPGSWILSSGTLYVHTIDGREPDANLLLFRSGNNIVATGNITLYLENLKVYGGNSPLLAQNTQSTDKLKVFAKDCDFYYTYSDANDAVMLQGTTLSVFKNCRAKYSQKDGFNYHANNSVIPKAIEIGCTGAFCGNDADSNDQGSTIHDGGSIIRINGLYHHNMGSNLADQGTDTEAWMIGCCAYASKAPNDGQNCNYFTYDDVHYWLDSCVGFGSNSNVYVHNEGSIVALRNCRMEGKLAPAGQEVVYY